MMSYLERQEQFLAASKFSFNDIFKDDNSSMTFFRVLKSRETPKGSLSYYVTSYYPFSYDPSSFN